jgi:hypothetical protein
MESKLGMSDLEYALPRLAASYDKGKLIPFTGAGISAKSIPLWKEMVVKLYKQNEVPFLAGEPATSQELIQASDHIVSHLMHRSRVHFVRSIKKSLGYGGKKIPDTSPNCAELSQVWWPMIISTNYDNMLVESFNSCHSSNDNKRLKVFGRAPSECHSLLSTLSAASHPVYWALQGHFGKSAAGKKLEEEIVMGYLQYRDATYNNPTFRAVFSEIYRSYSFMFVGLGLSEDYFLGLFGETLEKFGRNPYVHCALFSEQDKNIIDHQFLLKRLNIVSIFYPDEDKNEKFSGLPAALRTIREYIGQKSAKLWKARYGYMSVKELGPPKTGLELEISFSPLEKPNKRECVLFSAGRKKDGLKLSGLGEKAIIDYFGSYDNSLFKRINGSRCWRYGQTNVYAALARNNEGATSRESRDLRTVQEAFRDAILELYPTYSGIHCMLLSSGQHHTFPPNHSLVAMITGYREAIAEWEINNLDKKHCLTTIYIEDASVINYVRKHFLDIEDLMRCDDLQVNIEIRDDKNSQWYQIYLASSTKLTELSTFYNISDPSWSIAIEPVPYQTKEPIRPNDANTLRYLGVIPGSTIIYQRI